ncbi:hypothetical protein V8E54_005830 [Elaphomyces granulatus]
MTVILFMRLDGQLVYCPKFYSSLLLSGLSRSCLPFSSLKNLLPRLLVKWCALGSQSETSSQQQHQSLNIDIVQGAQLSEVPISIKPGHSAGPPCKDETTKTSSQSRLPSCPDGDINFHEVRRSSLYEFYLWAIGQEPAEPIIMGEVRKISRITEPADDNSLAMVKVCIKYPNNHEWETWPYCCVRYADGFTDTMSQVTLCELDRKYGGRKCRRCKGQLWSI